MDKFILGIFIGLVLTPMCFADQSKAIWLEKPSQTESTDMVDIMGSRSHKPLQNSEHQKPLIKTPEQITRPLHSYTLTPKTKKRSSSSLIPHKTILSLYNKKIPTFSNLEPTPKDCHPYTFSQELERSANTKDWIHLQRNYFSRCGRKLTNKLKFGLSDLAKMSSKKYKVFDNPQVHSLKIQLENNETVSGFLALKNTNQARPLVILKCGIFCSGKSSSSNNMILMSLFDTGPFHVLLLANHTGPDNIKDNQRVNFGGFLEGQEVIEVAQWVRQESEFKKLVSEVHVLGISLGGHAALYAGIYNEYLPEKAIDSIIGFCPVVNLENSLQDLLSGTTKNLAGLAIQYIVNENYYQVPYLNKYFRKGFKKMDIENMSRNLALANTDHIQSLNSANFLPPFQGKIFNDMNDFFSVSNYFQQSNKLSTPTFIWASKNDFIVKNASNSGQLEKLIPEPSQDRNISVLNVKKGAHCAVAESYGWNLVGNILKDFFVKNSPSLTHSKFTHVTALEIPQPEIKYNQLHMGQELLAFPEQRSLVIKYKIYKGPRYKDPFYARKEDFTYSYRQISFDDLPFSLRTANNEVEAQILTRWLNSNVTLKASGELPFRNRKKINEIEWISY